MNYTALANHERVKALGRLNDKQIQFHTRMARPLKLLILSEV
jgi:hypothetical protein